jgi:hypothetical protein
VITPPLNTRPDDGCVFRGETRRLLAQVKDSNQRTRSERIGGVYAGLRRLAARYNRSERPGHTLQASALAHEAYVQLFRQQDVSWQNRAHILAVAATIRRSTLIDYARARCANKRGNGQIQGDRK